LLPEGLDARIADATRSLARETRLLDILVRRMEDRGFSLDPAPGRFSLFGPDALLEELDGNMRIRVLRERLLARIEDPFASPGKGP